MSNRLIWILVIFWFILAFFAFYFYAFVSYNGTLSITSNVDSYKVSLYSKNLKNVVEINCPEKFCEIPKVSPFSYTITFSKPWYNDIVEDLTFARKEAKNLEINLEKKVLLEKKEIGLEKVIDKKEKLKELSKKIKYYFYDSNPNFGEVYLNENSGSLDLYINDWSEKFLKKFSLVGKENMKTFFVVWDFSKVVIKVGKEYFYYDKISLEFNKLDLSLNLKYVKTFDNKTLLFVTEKWSFYYNLGSKTFEYFNLFEDFVLVDDFYIWYIYQTDDLRKNNLWFTDKTWDLIVFYNPDSKEKKVLLNVDFVFSKLYLEENKIMVESDIWEKYEVKNVR